MKTARNGSRSGSAWNLAAFLISVVFTAQAHAQSGTYTWTGGGTNTNWKNAGNWSGGAAPTSSAGNILIFPDLAKAYTVNNNIASFQANQIQISNTSNTITLNETAGDPLTLVANGSTLPSISLTSAGNATLNALQVVLGGATTFTNSGTGTLTFSSVISETGGPEGLTISGTGLTILNGVNTFSGGTTITGGTLRINNEGAAGGSLGALTGTVNLNGGTLQFAGAGGVTLASSRAIVLGGGSIDTNGGNDTIAGQISGTTLTKLGGGSLKLVNATNSYSGGTLIQGGTLALGGAGILPAATAVTFGTSTTNGTLDLGGTNQQIAGLTVAVGATASSQIVGNSSLTNNSTLTINSPGISSFAGTIQDSISGGTKNVALSVAGGTVILTGANTYSGGTYVATGAVLQLGNGAASGSITGNVANAGTLTFDRSDSTGNGYVFSGNITGGGTVNQSGTAGSIVTLTGTNVINTLNVNTGVLRVQPGATSATTAVTVSDGAAFSTFNPGASPVSVGSLTLGALSGSGNTLNFDFVGAPATSSTTATGYVPFITVSQANGFISNSPTTINISNNGGALNGLYTLLTYAGTAPSPANFSVNASLARANAQLVLSNPGEIDLSVSQYAIKWTGTDPVNPTFWDVGTINTDGTPAAGNAGSINWVQQGGSNPATPFTQGDTVIFDNTAATFGVNLQAALNPSSVSVTSGNYTFSGTGSIGGSAALTISGSTTSLILSNTGVNSYSGGTFIRNGASLQVGDGTNSSSLPGNVVFNGGGTLIFNPGTANITYSGNISGNGSVSANANTVIFTGASNTYGGGTTIAAGAVLQIGDGLTSSGSLPTTGIANNGTLAFNPASSGYVFSGSLTSGAVSVLSTNTTVFTGLGNTYGGGTTIASGATLQIGDGSTSNGSLSGDVTNNGVLAFRPVSSLNYTGAVTGSGKLSFLSGTTVLTGAVTQTANSTIGSGATLQIGDGTNSGPFAGNIANSGTLAFYASPAGISYGGAAAVKISGSGGVNLLGGTTAFTNANSYSGATNIASGAVLVNGIAAAVPAGSAVTVATGGLFNLNGLSDTISSLSGGGNVTLNGATLTLNGASTTTFSGVISGAGGISRLNGGTTILSNQNTYLGSTNLQNNNSTIQISANNALPTTTTVTTSTATTNTNVVLDLNGFNQSVATAITPALTTGTVYIENNSNSGTSLLTITAGSGVYGAGNTATNATGKAIIRDNDGTAGHTGGNVAVTVAGGNWTLTDANTYSGGTTVDNGATLTLNFASTGKGRPAANILSPSTALTLGDNVFGGGNFILTGSTSAANSQTVNGLVINPGASAVVLNPSTATPNPLLLTLGAISTRNPGGVIDFTLPGGVQNATNGAITTTGNANFSGGQATILGGYATVGGNTWAVSGTGGGPFNITPLTTYDTTAGTFASGLDSDAQPGAITTGTGTLNSLRFNNPGAYTITPSAGSIITVATGGILVTSNVGPNNIAFDPANQGVLTSGNGQDLIITQNNSAGTFAIGAQISGGIGLTKSGPGTLILTASNNYSGTTVINGGALQVDNGSGSGTGSGSVVVNRNGALVGGGNIILNSGSSITVNGGGAIHGGDGVGTLTIGGSNSTVVIQPNGILDVAATRTGPNTAAGSLLNLTGAAGTLNLNPGSGTIQINLTSDGSLVGGESYTITLAATASANNIQLNGVTQTANAVIPASNVVIDPVGFSLGSDILSVDATGTKLQLAFTVATPEPAGILFIVLAAALPYLAWRRSNPAITA